MTLKEFISNRSRSAELREACGKSRVYLWQLANNWRGRRPSPKLALRLEAASGGVVSRHTLRPDIFGESPESVNAAPAPAVSAKGGAR